MPTACSKLRLHRTFEVAAFRQADAWQAVLDGLLAMMARGMDPNTACYHHVPLEQKLASAGRIISVQTFCYLVFQATACHERWEFGIALLSFSAGLQNNLPLITSILRVQAAKAWQRALNVLGLQGQK